MASLCPAVPNSHTVADQIGRTNIPLACGKDPGDETILLLGIESHIMDRFVRLGLPECLAIAFPSCMREWVTGYAVFMTAPSIATPAVTYFHNATSSFRAKATIVALRRPSIFVRSRNHLLSDDSG